MKTVYVVCQGMDYEGPWPMAVYMDEKKADEHATRITFEAEFDEYGMVAAVELHE